MLAVLLLRANRIVPVDALVDALWDDAPPPSARTTLHGYVKQLRQLSGPAAAERIVTRNPGYLIEVRPGELDLDNFTRLCDRGKAAAAAGDWEHASGLLADALALWRGDPLSGVPAAVLQRTEVPRLVDLRMRAIESRVEADLRLGRHGELVAELRSLAAADPLREGLHGQLMLALYGCGRQAEALEVYRGIDRRLRDELGIGPGPELRRTHQRMLAADPSLVGDVVSPSNAPPEHVAPAQLPMDVVDFAGREQQVKLLCDLLAASPDADRTGTVIISAVAGMGGIGKTALAVHVAHRLRDRFPGGQLYVNLQGSTDALRPAEVLARFLRDLGDPDDAIPAEEEERAARYRSLLATRRMLVVLDDARDAAQVRPLLPGSAGCAVIATSRDVLAALAGATQLQLDVLADDDAGRLFEAIVGAPRAAAEPEATAAVLACCAGLPLAIRIAGARLASRPSWSVADLAAKLADERGRLAELMVGDLAVRASFAVSYDALRTRRVGDGESGAHPARVFRLLGLPAMAELSLPAIAALVGQPPGQVSAALEALTDAHLLQSPAPERYRLHDLLRSYAAEVTADTDNQQERDAAVDRLLHWYAGQAVVGALLLAPAYTFPVIVPIQAGPPETMIGPAEALGWYAAELANLAAAVGQAAARGLHDVAAQIPIAVWSFFRHTAYTEVSLVMSEAAVHSARRLGDDAALSFALIVLGWVYSETGRKVDAGVCLTEALEVRRRAGDRLGEAMALNSLGINLTSQHRFEEAIDCLRSALDILAELGKQRGIDAAVIQNNLGDSLRVLNRHDEALVYLERSLENHREGGDLLGASITETTVAETYVDMGRYADAVRYCQRALAVQHDIARESRHEAESLCCLGDALAALGRAGEARDAWQAALPILDRLGDPRAVGVRGKLADDNSAR